MSETILIIDDEEDIRGLLSDILTDEGYKVLQAAHSMQAEHLIKTSKKIDLIILDIWLENSEKDGLELLDSIDVINTPVLMISGHGSIDTAVQAIRKGAYDFIEKPFKTERLLITIKRAIEATRLKKENQTLKQRNTDDSFQTDLSGESDVVQKLRKLIDKVAPTDSRILISGEAGTGKGLLAHLIHRKSQRADQNYTALNCAVLNPDNIEAELFGTKKQSGLIENVNGGTLFLDEVSDMPLETQSKFLRVLQDQKLDETTIDIRVIASTTFDLEELIRKGKFREDLYYRLNVVPIKMPSLRTRKEDIPILIDQITQQLSEKGGMPKHIFHDELKSALSGLSLPGNIRELRNIVEWIVIMAPEKKDRIITINDLPEDVKRRLDKTIPANANIVPNNASNNNHMDIQTVSLPLKEAREAFETRYLTTQLKRFDGNISKTADFVGMQRTALHRKLKTLGIADKDSDNT
ncbi:MAG: sigma-54-dependent Fis family transcriptional regulator [Micavibrio sp.]|nr:sigma-54-dependent Fis family transcriptional regulator [Micavibrio sp.]|tara:strand:+ start:796 stop:2193 length:1398 start_codon:yes stop_codon:yes gene_type:complete